ncbi:MAG: hypothetical protein ABIV11_09685, partial [Gemmatimonadaceae bacterium]
RRTLTSARDPHSPAWSPDGSRLAFVSGNPQFVLGSGEIIGNIAPSAVWIVSLDGRVARSITGDKQLNTSPVWDPSGQAVLYISTLRGGRDIYHQRLGRSGVPVGDPQRLTTGANAHGITLSQDGGTLIYSTMVSTSAVWSLPIPERGTVSVAEASRVTQANEQIEYVTVSADGEWIVFDSDRSGNQDIWKAPTRGGEAEQLTRDPADEFRPTWSPDGREISFHSWRKGNRDLLASNADGSGVRELAATKAHEYAGMWSPDGRYIAFPAEEGGQLYLDIVDRSGANRRRLPRITSGLGVTWSPDGQWVASSNGRVMAMVRPADSTYRVLATPADLAGDIPSEMGAFSSDGTMVYMITRGANARSNIWAVPTAGGTARRVVAFDDPERQPYRGGLSSDGKRFYFTIGKSDADLWAVELLKR